jgi:diamine N-acetyltransferase
MTSPPRVVLRALAEADLERTHRWHNDPELYSTLEDSFRFVSPTAESEWLKRKAGYSPNEINLAICLSTSGEHIGNLYLGGINWVSRRASLGMFIGSAEHRGKGYGQEALRQMLGHAFSDLNLNRVYLEVLVENAPAIKVYEKCGFAVEGRLPSHVFKNGTYRDVLVMGITGREFNKSE